MPARNLVIEKYTGEKMDAATQGAAAKAGVDEVMAVAALPEVLGRVCGGGQAARAHAVGADGRAGGDGGDELSGDIAGSGYDRGAGRGMCAS